MFKQTISAGIVLGMVLMCCHRSEAGLPRLPKPDYPVISAFDYRDSAAVGREWKHGDAAAAPTVQQLGARRVVKLTCNFAGTKAGRAWWDYSVSLDLTHCQGIKLQFYSSDMSSVSHTSIYFKSGGGWYSARMGDFEKGRWSTITVDKAATGIEGKPAGWGKIDAIRISPWRSADRTTELYFADLGTFNPDPPIALSRVENVGDGGKWHKRRSQRAAGCLRKLGLAHSLVSDADIRNGFLKNVEVLILPIPRGLPDNTADSLAKFVRDGGQVVAFGDLRRRVKQALKGLGGFHTTAFPEGTGGADELMALLGRIAPSLWQESAEVRISRIGKLGPYADYEEAKRRMRLAARRDRDVRSLLQRADGTRSRARRLYKDRKFEQAAAAAAEARSLMVEAYCTLQKPLEGEFRALWCHSAFGVKGMTWDEAIKLLADNGFTAILPNMLWGGCSYGKSQILGVPSDMEGRGDQIAECLAACKKYGVECHVWKVNWRMTRRAPKDAVARMKREGRVQVGFDGKEKSSWLCPSHPENQKLEIDTMLEVATGYDVDGIHFDYIRYPGNDTCFCEGCRERFERVIGRKVNNWPANVRNDPELQDKWQKFRQDNITTVVAGVIERVRKLKLKVKVSAAVFRNWPTNRFSVAQDWKLWCEKGYLDFVCPMDYTSSNSDFENIVRAQADWAGKIPYYPGIGVSLWAPQTIEQLIEQINITRRQGTGGFTIFQYSAREARDLVPLCGKGITRKAER